VARILGCAVLAGATAAHCLNASAGGPLNAAPRYFTDARAMPTPPALRAPIPGVVRDQLGRIIQFEVKHGDTTHIVQREYVGDTSAIARVWLDGAVMDVQANLPLLQQNAQAAVDRLSKVQAKDDLNCDDPETRVNGIAPANPGAGGALTSFGKEQLKDGECGDDGDSWQVAAYEAAITQQQYEEILRWQRITDCQNGCGRTAFWEGIGCAALGGIPGGGFGLMMVCLAASGGAYEACLVQCTW
jgi:hypothetical protein